jgi:hypothetical protein
MERGPSRLESGVSASKDTIEVRFEKAPEPEKEIELEKRCEFAVEGTNGKEHYILCRKQGECGDNKGIFLPISPANRTSLYDQTYKIVLPRCKVNGVLRYTGGR